jgi:hypothetical protein
VTWNQSTSLPLGRIRPWATFGAVTALPGQVLGASEGSEHSHPSPYWPFWLKKPPLQAKPQALLEQDTEFALAGAPQALPQLPQLPVLFVVFTSQPSAGSPSQSAKPPLQLAIAHFPAMQRLVPFARLHTLPQAPQFLGSVCSLTQAPLQLLRPAWHESVQAPAEQTKPPAQVKPHVPQFEGSLPTATHFPLQRD